jgi:hypothetical protein
VAVAKAVAAKAGVAAAKKEAAVADAKDKQTID